MSRRRGDTTVLVTLLFTDIVGSTEIAADLGDRRWRDLIQRHHALVREQLKRHRGRELDTAGDGFFARFDRPADAIRCACAIVDAVRELGIEVRAGAHLGEAELVEGKVGGFAVNVAARVMGVGKAGEVLVSSTLRDAVAGSGFGFGDHGVHRLKGIEGEWRLYDVTAVDGARRAVPLTDEEAKTRRGFVEGVPVGRRRDRLVAAALGAVVVALVAIGMLTDAFGGERKSEGGPRGPDTALLAVVPDAFRPSCRVSGSPPPDATASVDCSDGDLYEVTYSRFASDDALERAFEAFASAADQTATDCSRDPSARGEYTVNRVRAGEVACYLEEGTSAGSTRSVIVWTDEELAILGRAIRRDAADLTLFEWWRTEAGPWVTGARPPKDGDPASEIEGTFEAPGTSLTLTFFNGRYHESFFEDYGDSLVLYGKPSLILLFHESPPTTFGGTICPTYEVYRYQIEGPRLRLRLLEGSCREYSSHDIDGKRWTRTH